MDDSSRIVIDRAIAYAGGYDAWQQKKTLSFDQKASATILQAMLPVRLINILII